VLAECPNCRRPIAGPRTFFTPMWGTWRCSGCGALLGIDKRRRLLAMIPYGILLFVLLAVLHLPNWGYWLALPVVVAVGYVNFVLFDRAVVLERAGFRCRRCGYDLRGQIEPRCPECGWEFDAADTSFRKISSQREDPVDPAARAAAYRQPRGRRVTTALVFSLTSIALLLALVRAAPWTWLMNHPHSTALQVAFSLLIALGFFVAIVPSWRRPGKG